MEEGKVLTDIEERDELLDAFVRLEILRELHLRKIQPNEEALACILGVAGPVEERKYTNEN